ncbi:hypothetical protein HPB52_016064 [Rhipicephalus sanguineus]|uniref:Uncharacterized protein n=1 Tax=Rhipicephalus sanguineus TaxID=34632 RepID=A0A9D4Q0U8_RHISA|nr:hypothetical protein HPB52_016064 [Rhipicephalus sanguineus]
MSSRTDARRNLLAVSKKKTDGQRQFSRPLENKKFYFHFKNRRPPSQLSQDLTSLGARVEPFFGKDVSCVITDQQDLRSASTPPKPNSVDSSGPSTSPSVFTGVYKPLYRSLKQWPDVTAERCQQIASKPKETAPKEPAPLPKESAASTKAPVEPVNDSHLKGVPLRPGTSKAAPRVKVTEQKKLNCEICGCSYICLEKALSVKKGHLGVVKQSGFSGTISALRHLKVVRKESSPTDENLEETSMTGSPRPRKKPATFSNFETQAVVKKDSRTLLRCNAGDKKKSESGSRLMKRPATFSDFETQAIVKKDARAILCCSDMENTRNECVPPSFSSELNGTANYLLVGLSVRDSHLSSTPVKNAGDIVCNMSEVFDKASEELFSDSSTAEYSWTDVPDLTLEDSFST